MALAGEAVHGAAGFQKGCRCAACHKAEALRLRRIGRAETARWRRLNERADRAWDRQFEPPDVSPHKVRWSDQEIAYALDRSRAVDDIARALGRSAAAVWQIRRKHTKPCTCGASWGVS